jgi:UDPglucose 6-dehydrogenase
MRFAPSIDIIAKLTNAGAKVKAYDPHAMTNAKKIITNIEYCNNPYDVAKDCDALAVVTEWDEFKQLDMNKIKSLLKLPIIVDGRNIFDPNTMEKLGFIYRSIGR